MVTLFFSRKTVKQNVKLRGAIVCVHVLVQVCVYLQNIPGTCMLYLEEQRHVPLWERREKYLFLWGNRARGERKQLQ